MSLKCFALFMYKKKSLSNYLKKSIKFLAIKNNSINIHGKNDFAERSKILLDIDQKIILLKS